MQALYFYKTRLQSEQYTLYLHIIMSILIHIYKIYSLFITYHISNFYPPNHLYLKQGFEDTYHIYFT